MDRARDEVDELKVEIENLQEECHTKKELLESLKKSNYELLLKSKEVKTLIEQKSQDLDSKSEELFKARQICENLKSSLDEKESSFRHLNFVNEKLRVEYSEKVKSLEEQNKGLVVSLDEATEKIQDCDRKTCAADEEIKGLKKLLSIAEKKCIEAEEKTKESKELKCRDDIILEVEEENKKVKDQLKWKNEQFQHLEEAHELLQNQFHEGKIEWEREKSDLLKDLYSLKTSLDSQTKISEDLHSQLKMCNQALSHEESKRRILEIEVIELRCHFENVVLEFEEAKSKIEKLTHQRDGDIADLRNELGAKEALNKEMKYKITHLELENDELQGLLKECREEQIKLAGGASFRKLQNKPRSLEQLHGQCSVNLKKKEAEWNSRYEKMMEVVNGNLSDLKNKDEEIQELQKRLECCHYLMEFQNENEKIMLCENAEMGLDSKVFDRLENVRSAGPKEDCCMHVGICDELAQCEIRLKENFEQMETTLKRSSEEILYALELVNGELAKKIKEVDQVKLKLEEWKFSAEMTKSQLEENLEILKREKESFVGLVKEHDDKLVNLKKQSILSDAKVAEKMEDIKALEKEKEHYHQVAENKASEIRELKSEIAMLKQVFAEREREGAIQARLEAQQISKQEEERLLKVTQEKDQKIVDLHRWIMSTEQYFESEFMSSFSAITENQIKLDLLIESMEKVETQKQLEIQVKNKVIGELEKGTHDLCHELTFLKESLLHSSSQVAELKIELKAQKLETDEAKNQLSSKQAQVLELQHERENLLEEVRNMCAQREDMIAHMESAYDWISDLTRKDAELTNILENISQNADSISEELGETRLSPSTKIVRERSNQRSPLTALNQ